jgi:hypothetical protein
MRRSKWLWDRLLVFDGWPSENCLAWLGEAAICNSVTCNSALAAANDGLQIHPTL